MKSKFATSVALALLASLSPSISTAATATHYSQGFESYTTIRTTDQPGPMTLDPDSGVRFQVEDPPIVSQAGLSFSWGLDMVLPQMASAFGLSGLAEGNPATMRLQFFFYDAENDGSLTPVDAAEFPADGNPYAFQTISEFNYVRISSPTTSPDGASLLTHNSMRFGPASSNPIPEPFHAALLLSAAPFCLIRKRR